MQNTQLSFLTSLFAGKPGGGVNSNINVQPGANTDHPAGDGFFSFLQGLLTEKPGGDKVNGDLFDAVPEAPAPGTSIGLSESGAAKQAPASPIKSAIKPATSPISPYPDELTADMAGVSAVVAPAATEAVAGKGGAAQIAAAEAFASNPPGGVTSPINLTSGPSISRDDPDSSDPLSLKVEAAPERNLGDGESRIDAIGKTKATLPTGTAAPSTTGVAAIIDNGSAEAQSHALLTSGDAARGVDSDRFSSQRLELAVASDRSMQLNPVRDQIIAAVSARLGDHKLEIRLDPPELGKVLIGFERDGADIVRAVISADSPHTLDLMRRHADVFQRALEAQGFENLDLHFADKGPRENTDPEDEQTARDFRLANEDKLAGGDAQSQLTASGRLDRRL